MVFQLIERPVPCDLRGETELDQRACTPGTAQRALSNLRLYRGQVSDSSCLRAGASKAEISGMDQEGWSPVKFRK